MPPRAGLLGSILLALAGVWSGAAAQAPGKINIYRFILDVDVPESAGLVALDAATSHVLRGSAPKPIAVSLVHRWSGTDTRQTGVALDIVPYFLVGGGERRLVDYWANSVAGRLKRVVTKTSLSISALSDPSDGSSLLGGLAIRTTFHDPHDPVLNSRLPEQVDSALAAHGAGIPISAEEEVAGRGVDLTSLYAAVRRQMRARGDVQVSAGYGLAGRVAGAMFEGDSVQSARHTLWLTAQHALGHRLDLLATAQVRGAEGTWKPRIGAGIQRKSRPTDFRAELYYDGVDKRLYPGVSVEVHAVTGIGAVASLTTDTPMPRAAAGSRVRLNLLLRWYSAQRG
jgi:hypothetical protein